MLRDYFVKVSRNILNTPYYKDASLLKAWMGLVLSVRFQPYTYDGIDVGVDEVLLKKNEVAELFGTEKRRALTILKRMERDGLIEFRNIKNRYTLIKILNADFSFPRKKKERERGEEKNRYSEGVFADENTVCDGKEEEIFYKSEKRYEPRQTSSHTAAQNETGINTSGKRKEEAEINKKSSAEAVKTKSAYGEFNNVFLTKDEYASLVNQFSEAGIFISKLSAYLASNPSKKYPNHYAVILSWYNDYLLEKTGKTASSGGAGSYRDLNRVKNEDVEPDPTASYDIKRAEMLARRCVPPVKKRNRETGQWEVVKKAEAGA